MTAEVLGVEYTMVKTNPMEGDTRTPEFLAINPQHNIPAILDGMQKLKVICLRFELKN
jgi:glutathione S-transferase